MAREYLVDLGRTIDPVGGFPPPEKPGNETRIMFVTSGQSMSLFLVDTTLFEVARRCEQCNVPVKSFTTNSFPKTTWERKDFGVTLKEAGLVPRAVLIVKEKKRTFMEFEES